MEMDIGPDLLHHCDFRRRVIAMQIVDATNSFFVMFGQGSVRALLMVADQVIQ
jgi:hypothetical protein